MSPAKKTHSQGVTKTCKQGTWRFVPRLQASSGDGADTQAGTVVGAWEVGISSVMMQADQCSRRMSGTHAIDWIEGGLQLEKTAL